MELSIFTLPLFLLTLLFALSAVNPMVLGFRTTFEIINETNERVLVTPIGAIGPQGSRRMLPLSNTSPFHLTGARKRAFPIPPGSSRTFTYDWDDIQFSEILIRGPSGDVRAIGTGLDPIEGQYRVPERNRFVIDELDGLPKAEEHHLSALRDSGDRRRIGSWLAVVGLVWPVFFLLARKAKSRELPRAGV